MMKIQAVVIVNFDAKTDAKRTVDNSETEKQMQTNFKQFGFSFQKKAAPQHLIPICFAYKT